jgi:hypothetical protein
LGVEILRYDSFFVLSRRNVQGFDYQYGSTIKFKLHLQLLPDFAPKVIR